MANTSPAALEIIKTNLLTTRPTFDDMNLNKLSFNKELEFALQMFEKNDYLAKMNPQSIKNALVNVSLSGLTLNPIMKFAYLVPRKGICCVDPSYSGLVKIVTDTGSVKSVKADVAYEKDVFDIELGSGGYVKHKPFLGAGERGRKIGVYSIAVLNDGSEHIEFMRWADVEAIMRRSESVKAGKTSPWDTDPDEMAKKTVVKRQWKYLPKSERALVAAQAIEFDNQANGINFEKERQEAPKTTVNATPDAPEEALATDEDVTIMNGLFNDPAMPEMILRKPDGTGGYKKTVTQTAWNEKAVKGQLTKSKVENYIKLLQKELPVQTEQEA